MNGRERAAERLVRAAWKTPPSIRVRGEELTQAVLLDLAPEGVAECRDARPHWDSLPKRRQDELQRAVNAGYLERLVGVVEKLAHVDSYYATDVALDAATVALVAATHPTWAESHAD